MQYRPKLPEVPTIYFVTGNLVSNRIENTISLLQLLPLLYILRRQQINMAIAGAQRKQVLKVLMISLLLDLVRKADPHPTCNPLKQSPDLLYLHPPTLPFPSILLPRSRSLSELPPQPYLPLPKRLQERLRPPHRLSL